VIGKIGEGSFGIVYKCEFQDRLVAVKRSIEKYEGVRDRLQKIEEVVKIFRICSDPGDSVIQVIECWEETGYLYICTELCNLGNLNDYLVQESYVDLTSGESDDWCAPPMKRRSSLLVRGENACKLLPE